MRVTLFFFSKDLEFTYWYSMLKMALINNLIFYNFVVHKNHFPYVTSMSRMTCARKLSTFGWTKVFPVLTSKTAKSNTPTGNHERVHMSETLPELIALNCAMHLHVNITIIVILNYCIRILV